MVNSKEKQKGLGKNQKIFPAEEVSGTKLSRNFYMKLKYVLYILLIVLTSQTCYGETFSAGIFPGGKRRDKSVQCIANEMNRIFFYVKRGAGGELQFSDLKEPLQDLKLKIYWPDAEAELLGFDNHHDKGKDRFQKPLKSGTRSFGKQSYSIYEAIFTSDGVQKRLIKRPSYLFMHIWFKAPKKLQSAFRWELCYGDQVLCSDENPLISVGTIDDKRQQAKTYIMYSGQPGAGIGGLPTELALERVKLLRRLGLNVTESLFHNGPRPLQERNNRILLDNGITVAGLRLGGYENLFKKYYSKKAFEQYGGVIHAMDAFCKKIRSSEERFFVKHASPFTNAFAIDWEPHMLKKLDSSWSDQGLVKAFMKEQKISDDLSKPTVQKQYANDYHIFRDRQFARPIGVLRDIFKHHHPEGKFYGTVSWKAIDCEAYIKYLDYCMPMIYHPSIMGFFQECAKRSSQIPRTKLLPFTTFGTWRSRLYRFDVDSCIQNALSPALLGARGIANWPGIAEMDGGMLFALHRTKQILAETVEIFQNGQPCRKIKLRPLPLLEKTIQTAGTNIDLSYPQWDACGIWRAYESGSVAAFAALNFHKREDMFLAVDLADRPGKYYLINHDDRAYYEIYDKKRDADNILLKIPAGKWGFWLVTSAIPETSFIKLDPQKNRTEFTAAKKRASESALKQIQLGKTGDIEIGYESIKCKNQQLPVLTVKTAFQKLGFSTLGGRIMEWKVAGSGNQILQDINTGGSCMDLFWVPKSSRWSGDQIMDMNISECHNDGKTARVTFEGTINRALELCHIRKTFEINAKSPGIKVSVQIRNGGEVPQSIGYWSHHVFNFGTKACEYLLCNSNGKIVASQRKTAFYPAEKLTQQQKDSLLGYKKHAAFPVRRNFGIHHCGEKRGFIFIMPENFLMNYRFGSNDSTCADIMLKPVKVASGNELKVNFEIIPTTGNCSDFKKTLTSNIGRKVKIESDDRNTNLLTGLMKSEKNFQLKSQENFTMDIQNGILSFTSEKKKNSLSVCSKTFTVSPGQKYLLSMAMKVDSMWLGNGKKDYFIVFVYNRANNAHTYMYVKGRNVSSDWTKILLPFDADKLLKKTRAPLHILWKANNVSGSFKFRNISLIKLPSTTSTERGVEKNGKFVPCAVYKVTP